MTQKRFLLLAVGLATSLPSLACTTCDEQTKAVAPAATAAPGGDALTVGRDAATGQLRPATAAELGELTRQQGQSSRSARTTTAAVPTTPLLRRAPNGAVNVRLTPEFLSYSVAVRLPDGSLASSCVHAPDGRGALAQARATLVPAAPAAELQ